jgi:hypothetical protein
MVLTTAGGTTEDGSTDMGICQIVCSTHSRSRGRTLTRLLAATFVVTSPRGLAQTPDSTPRGSASSSDQVIVTGEHNTDATEISQATLELVHVPGSLGDPLSAVFSLPGVVSAGGDNGVPAVRGSGPADNLYRVDSLPVPYIFHAFDIGGSVFNENILKSFNLYASGYGPAYANVTGGVFDIALRDPKSQPLTATVDLSFLRSGIFLESAITEHSAAYLSARVSNLTLFTRRGSSSEDVVIERPPRDNDYQFRYVWNVADNQKITLGATGATDSLGVNFEQGAQVAAEYPYLTGDARSDTRYNNQTLAWDFTDPSGPRLRVAGGHSTSNYDASYGAGYFYNESLTRDSGIVQYDSELNPSHTIHLTAEVVRNQHGAKYDEPLYVCNEFNPDCNDTLRGYVVADQSLTETESTLALSDTWRLGRALTFDVGGQFHKNSYTGEHFVNPRTALTWAVAEHSTVTLKAGTYNRFPNLDTILPEVGNPHLRSSRADHFSAGFRQDLEDGWSWNVDGYYKKLWDLPLALSASQPDASLLYNNDVSGRAYGLDLMLDKKPTGPWYGWIAASIGKSTRTDEQTGAVSNYYLDTPFILNAVANYQWRPWISVGARATVHSGQADTPIVGVEENTDFPGHVAPVFGTPYSTRLPMYERLDAQIKWTFRTRFPSSLTIDVINVLNRHNVESQQLDYTSSTVGESPILKKYDGFGLLPVLSYRVTF